MVLSSQQARDGTGRNYMFARPRKARRRWVALLMIAFALMAAWYFQPWNFISMPSRSRQSQNEATNNDPTNATPGETTRVAGAMDPTPQPNLPAEDDRTTNPPNRLATNDTSSSRLPAGDIETITDTPPTNNTDQGSDAHEDTQPPAIVMGAPSGNTGGNDATPSPIKTDRPAITGVSVEVDQLILTAERLVNENRLVDARRVYNTALHHREVGPVAAEIRDRMTEINAILIFSPSIDGRDPFVVKHRIQSGDRLSLIGRKYSITDDFIAHINGLKDKNQIRAGATIKLIQGPFHAVVSKNDFRLDLYAGAPDANGHRMYVRSFLVGLGELNSTPIGSWIVPRGGKVYDPDWRNPRTGEYFKPSDPKNPIGDYWVGIKGTDGQTSLLSGYGIHGTIDPGSIGREASMGCVRMRDTDIRLVFQMLYETKSTVQIIH